MATVETPAEQFDDLEQQRRTVLLGMWVFLTTELLLFGTLFTAFIVLRVEHTAVFAHAATHLDLVLGSINTAILLTSGLTMALAERAALAGLRRSTLTWLGATLALGTAFLAIKGYEWYAELKEELVPLLGLDFVFPDGPAAPARRFFESYFALTGLHALHMIAGLAALAVLALLIRRWRHPGRLARQVRITGLYWAFVDVVWIFVFTVLYLLRQ